jgi:hypothetical protein
MGRVVIGLIVSGLAVVFGTIGVILGGHAGRVAMPLENERETITLTASGASYLSPTRLAEVTGARIVVTDTIKGTAEAGFPLIAVWSEVSAAYDATSHQRLEPTARTFAFDSRTAELVNCCDESVNGNAAIQQSGIAGWQFPRGTRKQTYHVFDPTLSAAEPFAYSGTDLVDGIRAYRFTESISHAKAGFSPIQRAYPQLYTMHQTYWVDPETGALLKISEDEDLYLVKPASGVRVAHVFDADLSTTPASVASLVSRDLRARDAGTAAARDRLLFFGLAGVLAVAAAIVLLAGRGERRGSRHSRGAGEVPPGPAAPPWPQPPEADRWWADGQRPEPGRRPEAGQRSEPGRRPEAGQRPEAGRPPQAVRWPEDDQWSEADRW